MAIPTRVETCGLRPATSSSSTVPVERCRRRSCHAPARGNTSSLCNISRQNETNDSKRKSKSGVIFFCKIFHNAPSHSSVKKRTDMTKIAELKDKGAVVAWSPLSDYADVLALGSKVRFFLLDRRVSGGWGVWRPTRGCLEGLSMVGMMRRRKPDDENRWQRQSRLVWLIFS